MNPLLDVLITHGLLLDALGVLGLGLVGFAAARLARSSGSRGGTLMASGAIALLLARLYFITAPHFMSLDFQIAIGPAGIAATIALPPLLLVFGLLGIVSGFWQYERTIGTEVR